MFSLSDISLTIREKDLQRQVQTAKNQLRDMHTSNESSQAKLLDASQRQGQFFPDIRPPLSLLTDAG